MDLKHVERMIVLLGGFLVKQLKLSQIVRVQLRIIDKVCWQSEGLVHGGSQHGVSEDKEGENNHKLPNVQETFPDNDGPGSEQRVEGKEVEDLNPAEEKSDPHELVPDVHDDAPVGDVHEYCLEVEGY